jgi:hypothetical protein
MYCTQEMGDFKDSVTSLLITDVLVLSFQFFFVYPSVQHQQYTQLRSIVTPWAHTCNENTARAQRKYNARAELT